MNFRMPLLLASALAAGACSTESDRATGTAGAVAGTEARPRAIALAPRLSMNDAATRHRFAGLPDRGDLVVYPTSRVVRHDGAYTWHRVDLSESHARSAVGGVLSMRMPSGEQVKFRYERHVEHASGDWTWIGSVVGRRAEEAIITFGAKAAFGSIAHPGKEPVRLTIRDGVSWLVSTDPRQIALLNNVGTRPTAPDFVVAPDLVTRAAASAAAASDDGTMMSTSSSTVNGVTRLDLLLGYTPGFVDYYGGQSQALTRLNNMVDITNEAYVNSQMPTQIRLVKTLLVNYTDSNSNKTALEEVTGFQAPSTSTTPNPAFTELRNAREQFGADLVSVVRRFNTPENDGCGIAWLIGGGRKGLISASSEYFGYSIVSDGKDVGADGKTYFCRDETLAHEIGHNLGSAHDRDTADGEDNVLQTNEYGVFDYSFGYKTASGSGNFFTVMAYGDSGQTRYRAFSNPRVTFCGGLACGVEGGADNARSQTNTFPSVAAFRGEKVNDPPPPPPPTPVAAAGRDINGDGRSDVMWINPDIGELHYFLLNGSSTIGGKGDYFVPVGFRVAAAADFSGDGRADVLWENGVEVRMSLATTSGTYAASQVVMAYPAGWQLMRSGDINADGRGDMVWFNPDTGEIHYFVMAGTSIAGGRGAYYLPKGYRVQAIADTNGDGRADIVSSNGADVRISLAQADGGFAVATPVFSNPAGWTLAGSADVNGDKTSDLIWHHQDLGEVHVHCLQGATITCNRGGYYLPRGQLVRQFGDFNGDGRVDILSSNGLDVRVSLANPNGFDASAPLMNYVTGWLIGEDHIRRPAGVGDVNRDNRSDLLWFNGTTREFHYHLMNGAQIIGGRGAFFAPTGFVPAGVGDFNGDGRFDMVLAGNGEGRVMLAQSDGSWAVSGAVFTLPAGWQVAGAGDIDGDGKSDIVVHSASLRETHVFFMVGTAIVSQRGGYFMPEGFSIRAIADLDRDGLADLVWADAVEVRVSLARPADAFAASVRVMNNFAGWTLAGATDMDGDRRADFLWHNGSTGELFYYFMNGTVALGGQGGYVMPVGTTIRAVGDFNADGRSDLVWSNGSRIMTSMGQAAGGLGPPIDVSGVVQGWRIVDTRSPLN